MNISGDKLAEWLRRLVQIPSVTPDQAGPRAGRPGELRLANQVAEWFTACGAAVPIAGRRWMYIWILLVLSR